MKTLTCILLAVIAGVMGSPAVTPTPSVLSCENGICTDGVDRFSCHSQGLVCCRGAGTENFQVLKWRDGFKCCHGAGKLYSFQQEICVSGQVRSRGADEDNCGLNKVYNVTTQVCCNDLNVFDKVEGAVCCAGEYLTNPEESCCNGIKYITSEKVCCPRRENDPRVGKYQLFDIPGGRCCADQPYNPANQSCESQDGGYVLWNRSSSDMKMCGGQMYDPTSHDCCSAMKVFKRSMHLCHHGVLYEKTDPNQDAVCIYNDGQKKAILYTSNEKTVCGREGVISLGPSEAKCGSDIYNKQSDLCCSGKVYRNVDLDIYQCCEGGTNKYNPSKQICCVNEVINRPYNDGARCCLKTPYQEETHECRDGIVMEKACPSYGNKCNVTLEALQRMDKVYLYFGTAGEMTDSRGRKKLSRKWAVTKMQTFKFRKGKVLKSNMRGNYSITSSECGCPEHMVPEAKYMFISAKPISRKDKKLDYSNKKSGFIIPVLDTHQIGIAFETLINNSQS